MYEPIYDVGVPRMRNTVAHRGLNRGWTLACPAISHSLAEGSPTVVFAMRSGFSLGAPSNIKYSDNPPSEGDCRAFQ